MNRQTFSPNPRKQAKKKKKEKPPPLTTELVCPDLIAGCTETGVVASRVNLTHHPLATVLHTLAALGHPLTCTDTHTAESDIR